MNLAEVVKAAGVVGAGGAGFPTHIKINTKAECFIINAAECEPLIETDKYLCRMFADDIVEGILIVAKHLEAKRKVIALKAKYVDEIKALKAAIVKAGADIEIHEMKTFYPAGDEQVIVQQICHKSVPEGGIPLDVGVVVNNVGTVIHVKDALSQIPVTDKFLSITGEVDKAIMVKAPIGTSIRACIEKAKVKIPNYVVLLGGPMMGKIIEDQKEIDETVVTKTMGNLLILPPDHYLVKWNQISFSRMTMHARSACIQCRMCTDLCPRYLIGHNVQPHAVMRNIWRESSITDMEEYKNTFESAINCCDCGLCEMFSCPMSLSPCRVNRYIKKQFREKGIKVERNRNPIAKNEVDIHKVPTGRLVSRLGLGNYEGMHAKDCFDVEPKEVMVLLSQHIGAPAIPVVAVGDQVKRGDLIAKATDTGLSANIHGSLDGVITEVTAQGIMIRKKEDYSWAMQ